MRKFIIAFLVLVLASCSYLPFTKKKTDAPAQTQKKTEKEQDARSGEPRPGDIKVIDGVEYIYARNRRFMHTPYEPEYIWLRKDQYSPGIGENLLSRGREADKRERDEMERRIAKLEEDLKKKGIAPQMAYPSQMAYFPGGTGFSAGAFPVPFNYPSPKMKRRVIVLPFADQTNFKEESLGELATKRLISRLENTGAIICVDPNTINPKIPFSSADEMKSLNEIYGVRALLKGTLSDIYTSTARLEGKEEKGETSFAISRISIDVFQTETGSLLKQLTGRNPVALSREKGELSSEKAKMKAIDLSIELIAEDLLRAVLFLDWHGRIASVESDKIYLNSGRLSGLDKGSVLEVYGPGQQVVDPKTKLPLGNVKGTYKGDIEVVELFGMDAAWAKVVKGANFSSTDLVYLKN